MTSISIDPRVDAFAAEVRARLGDLGPEEVTELTEGLEADLAERLADTGDLGDATAYARELRESAGLPAQGPHVPPIQTSREWWAERRAQALAFSRRRGVAPITRFLVALRPVWWFARGFALFLCIGTLGARLNWLLPADPLGWIVLAALVVLSVQWGRGIWLGSRFLRILKAAASVVAVLVLMIAIPSAINQLSYAPYSSGSASSDSFEAPIPEGLRMNGEPVDNIFAFDCAGEPINRVQLFDAGGKPLVLEETDENGLLQRQTERGELTYLKARTETAQGSIYNAYPLPLIPTTTDPNTGAIATPTPSAAAPGEAAPGEADAGTAVRPFERARPLPGCPSAPTAPAAPTEEAPAGGAPAEPAP
ncbi:hypothetical protein D9V34_05025 [Mycetocola lacteus]|uniref:Uncharacterized protein n=1 Tax=Mycetocola lacteus TaxID=76637 RepID=A0A3L7AVE5_9MICO|nr:hypothetical protein [Mycetocola lacteus]RLP84154.1 hypothetical protein D9V34_05025 [Mycetocola lacteus]